jgi:hypothetical protein
MTRDRSRAASPSRLARVSVKNGRISVPPTLGEEPEYATSRTEELQCAQADLTITSQPEVSCETLELLVVWGLGLAMLLFLVTFTFLCITD